MTKKAEKSDTGKTFGHPDDSFQIGELLGVGTQGRVYQCVRLLTQNLYAVKKVDVGTLEMQARAGKVRVNLKREIKIMRSLTHPRIANLLEAYWEGKDICYVVMDLCRHGNLHDRLMPKVGLKGPENASKYVTWQLLEGLGYMHEKTVIHRDMKPANIIVAAERKAKDDTQYDLLDVKITDFGLSRAMSAPGGVDEGMTSCGTPAFAAPEVLLGSYDYRADYWSLGAIIFTMLCGEYPFDDMPDHIRHPKKYTSGPAAIKNEASLLKKSVEAQNIVRGLLACNPDERLGFDACCQDDWLMKDFTTPLKSMEKRDTIVQPYGKSERRVEQIKGCWEWVACWRSRVESSKEKEPLKGVFKEISGWYGDNVKRLDLTFQSHVNSDYEELSFGESSDMPGLHKQQTWSLEDDELIIGVQHEATYNQKDVGSAIVFFTSKGRSLAVQGSAASARRRFVAPVGSQIVALQFEEPNLVGIHLEKVPADGRSRIKKLTGWIGYAVDSLEIHSSDGIRQHYGKQGGDMPKEFVLEDNEFIRIVEHRARDGYLGAFLAFYTSLGRVYTFFGLTSLRASRDVAPVGHQICGFSIEDGLLVHLQVCPDNGIMALTQSREVRPHGNTVELDDDSFNPNSQRRRSSSDTGRCALM